jgi:hypothetical protein
MKEFENLYKSEIESKAEKTVFAMNATKEKVWGNLKNQLPKNHNIRKYKPVAAAAILMLLLIGSGSTCLFLKQKAHIAHLNARLKTKEPAPKIISDFKIVRDTFIVQAEKTETKYIVKNHYDTIIKKEIIRDTVYVEKKINASQTIDMIAQNENDADTSHLEIHNQLRNKYKVRPLSEDTKRFEIKLLTLKTKEQDKDNVQESLFSFLTHKN